MSGLFNGLAVVATAFGVAGSLGVGALQINSGINKVFGLPVNDSAQIGIILVATAIFLALALCWPAA